MHYKFKSLALLSTIFIISSVEIGVVLVLTVKELIIAAGPAPPPPPPQEDIIKIVERRARDLNL